MNLEIFHSEPFQRALITAAAMGTACALLSVFVVLRRWAFIGEGIAHAGFGGIGTAWLLSLVFPVLGNEGAAYGIAILFCLAMAVSIGVFSQSRRLSADAAIGIFLVASLAWGFLTLSIYQRQHPSAGEASVENYLFGQIRLVSPTMMVGGVAICGIVVMLVSLLGRQILCYAFDPEMAQVSGVPVRFIHFLLMLLLALVIVIGMRLAGNLLITALLILPGATALLLSRRLMTVIGLSIATALIGTLGGLLINGTLLPGMPSGPGMVLILFVEFLLAFAWAKVRG